MYLDKKKEGKKRKKICNLLVSFITLKAHYKVILYFNKILINE